MPFFTAAERPPPTGFCKPCTLNFNALNVYPMASTCALVLTLPTMYYNTYHIFRNKMLFAFRNYGNRITFTTSFLCFLQYYTALELLETVISSHLLSLLQGHPSSLRGLSHLLRLKETRFHPQQQYSINRYRPIPVNSKVLSLQVNVRVSY